MEAIYIQIIDKRHTTCSCCLDFEIFSFYTSKRLLDQRNVRFSEKIDIEITKGEYQRETAIKGDYQISTSITKYII